MLMDGAIPRRADGAIDLCADCQRWMWFNGGYLPWLTNQLTALSKARQWVERIPKYAAQMKVGEHRRWMETNRVFRGVVRERIRDLAFELKRNYRLRIWTSGLIEVWRLA
jgi:hypothetical protein